MNTFLSRIKQAVSLILVISMIGCSLVNGEFDGDRVDREVMAEQVSAVIIDQWDSIEPYLEDIQGGNARGKGESIYPEEVINSLLQEEGGEDYLSFCYAAAVQGDADAALRKARELLPGHVYREMLEEAAEVQDEFDSLIDDKSRSIQEEFREDFMRDMQQLVARTIVLLTAATVYAFMPHALIFAKISAAAAISIAAGAVAITVMAIWRHYEFGGDLLPSFEEWLKAVTTEPQVSYAMATSVISMATSMNMSPVSCGIILGVFAIYQAVDMLRTMLAVYEE